MVGRHLRGSRLPSGRPIGSGETIQAPAYGRRVMGCSHTTTLSRSVRSSLRRAYTRYRTQSPPFLVKSSPPPLRARAQSRYRHTVQSFRELGRSSLFCFPLPHHHPTMICQELCIPRRLNAPVHRLPGFTLILRSSSIHERTFRDILPDFSKALDSLDVLFETESSTNSSSCRSSCIKVQIPACK